jgi:hypothetical protein
MPQEEQKQSNPNSSGKETQMTESANRDTEGQWTATMASEDYTSAGLDARAREVVCHLREQGEFPAQLADAIESGRAAVEGNQIVNPTDGAVLAEWDEFSKRARKWMSRQERMDELRAKAAAKVLERQARFADFITKEYPTVDFAGAGVCEHVRATIERMWLREPAFRLARKPRDAWELINGYCDAIDGEELWDVVFEDAWEAFDAGLTLGGALARHRLDHLGPRAPEVPQNSQVGDRHE